MTRFAQTTAFLLLGLLQAKFASSIEVGDEVCLTGYIMDNFCVENVRLLDNSRVKTLEQPEEHSFHCLLDVGICIRSGFQVLGPKNPETGMHCGGFRIDNDESDVVLEAGRSLGRPGYCSTCEGNRNGPEYGYSATVRGTISALGDGSDDDVKGTPILKNVRVTNNEECEVETAPPLCTHLRVVTNEPTDEPSPSPSIQPSTSPVTDIPTPRPSFNPSRSPVRFPTTEAPTSLKPSQSPNLPPSQSPVSMAPSDRPSSSPMTSQPSVNPTTSRPSSGSPTEFSLSCPVELAQSIEIDNAAVLRYAVVPASSPTSANGILCGRLEAEAEAWIGLAFSLDDKMSGSEGIIGLPDEGTVKKYALSGYSAPAEMEADHQTLRDTSISQNDGRTIMSFTKLLEESDEIRIKETGANWLLHARGSSNSFGYHRTRLAFQHDFSEDTGRPTPMPANPSATTMPNDNSPTGQEPTDIDPLNDAEGASRDEGENVTDPPVAAPVEESETTAVDTSEGVVGEPSELDEVNSSVFAHSSIAVVAGFASMLLLTV